MQLQKLKLTSYVGYGTTMDNVAIVHEQREVETTVFVTETYPILYREEDFLQVVR